VRTYTIILLTVALLSGCGGGGGSSGSDEVTVDLAEQNGSGESGTATLTADGEKTKVVLNLENAPAVPQPAHIHEGSCADLDPNPAYGLTNVMDGMSTTEVDEPLDELREEDYAINVHKSGTDLKTYVACGDIGSGEGDTNTSTGSGY
jgi:hypothetical protein